LKYTRSYKNKTRWQKKLTAGEHLISIMYKMAWKKKVEKQGRARTVKKHGA